MIGLKFTNRFGPLPRPSRNASPAGMLSGTAWCSIEKSAGRKLIANFRRRRPRRTKMILHCNFICADWSRFFFSWRRRRSNNLLKDEIRRGEPEGALRRTEYPDAIRNLISQLRQMPGVGPRSAERIALWMVRARNDQPEHISRAIADTRQSIRSCNLCGFFAAEEVCEICADPSRSGELLCVVEQPTDILPLEKTGVFLGRYHSLGGKISPLDHVAPEDLRIKELLERIDREKITEIVFALPADVEGEATTNYIVDLLKNKPISLTRIARGIPAGGGLESADELTLSAALSGRTKL